MNPALRLVAWVLALALVALPIAAVFNGWIGAGQWPLTRLRATAPFERVDAAQLRAVLLPHARRGFFAVDLDRATIVPPVPAYRSTIADLGAPESRGTVRWFHCPEATAPDSQ